MDQAKALMRVTDRLYAAVTTPAEWSPAVGAMNELLRTDHAGILAEGGGSSPFLGSDGIEDSARDRCLSPQGWPLVQAYWSRLPIEGSSPAPRSRPTAI